MFPALNLATVSNLTKIYPTVYKNLFSDMKYFLPVSQSAFYTLHSTLDTTQIQIEQRKPTQIFTKALKTLNLKNSIYEFHWGKEPV